MTDDDGEGDPVRVRARTRPVTPDVLAAWGSGGQPAPYALLADRPDGTVVRCGGSVAKAHAPDSDPRALAARLRLAGSAPLAGILLRPLRTGSLHARPVSLWPYGTPVDPGRPEGAPWEAAARLLAALHRVPPEALPGPVPPMRGPAKVARALDRLERTPHPEPEGAGAVRAAARALPGWVRGQGDPPPGGTLCHGDFHLGQLVRHPAPGGPWRLIDVDDLGLGTPTWDLARPAAWYAAGILPAPQWLRFLDAYRAAGGPAAGPPGSDPWPELDLAARALTVQTAALALAKSARAGRRLDEAERLVVEACGRMVSLPPELESEPAS
ncbi:phosphotransferase [Streptomyces sp. NPDC087917]|uniref:phosphotransferase family protein n=1 Tax=Streptomyces sp. NPDC087917 TaxID=3155060 RepID=UPI0034333762